MAVKKYWKEGSHALISTLREKLAAIDDFSNKNTEEICHSWIVENNIHMGHIMNAFRVAIVGQSKGFGMYEMCEVIGKEETLSRLDKALATLPVI